LASVFGVEDVFEPFAVFWDVATLVCGVGDGAEAAQDARRSIERAIPTAVAGTLANGIWTPSWP